MPTISVSVYLNTKLFSDHKYTFSLNEGQTPTIRFDELSLIAKLHLKNIEEDEILDVAYSLTQTKRIDWYENPEVELIVRGEQRSTSVGDVFEYNDKFWMISVLGFTEIYPQR
ncbi:MAG: hypothetical protein RMY28_036140 [Nostoc sp. ChiSLP01]|nr:hypothetical protein [Nostoc sp. CmiSLP01]MDZ8282562.1 hypothetical protein [Nostoc sp. ChiSLP01]